MIAAIVEANSAAAGLAALLHPVRIRPGGNDRGRPLRSTCGAWKRNNALHPRHPWSVGKTVAWIGALFCTAVAIFSFVGVYDGELFCGTTWSST